MKFGLNTILTLIYKHLTKIYIKNLSCPQKIVESDFKFYYNQLIETFQ